MKKHLINAFIFLLIGSSTCMGAQKDSLRTLFLDAESWFLFEEYSDALPLYEELLKSDPGNDNFRYRIGRCLLNDPFRKDQAIFYLQKASQNINPNHKETSFRERTAPVDALFYLGNAYLVNEMFGKAVESYEEFLLVMDPAIYDEELVKIQLACCENAIKLKEDELDLDLYLLDTKINTRYSEVHPVISGDGNTMAYVTELPFYDGAFVVTKKGDQWSYPRQVTQEMGFDANVYPVCLNYDGSEMILYNNDDYIGNLYVSKFEEGVWKPAKKLGEPISTKFWESHACFSRDGQMLYFTSNRKGGYGDLDIYRSQLGENGKWEQPENLGDVINTPYNEEAPWISEDGKTLYFSSYGHFNMGGYDIFSSTEDENGNWSEPKNLGYPINTTDDDLYYQPVNNGRNAYYSLYSPVGAGRYDIYYLTLYSDEYPRPYEDIAELETLIEEELEVLEGKDSMIIASDTSIYDPPTAEIIVLENIEMPEPPEEQDAPQKKEVQEAPQSSEEQIVLDDTLGPEIVADTVPMDSRTMDQLEEQADTDVEDEGSGVKGFWWLLPISLGFLFLILIFLRRRKKEQ